MPREPRIVVPGRPHHVILRGNNRRRLFSSNPERFHFLGLLAKALQRGEVQLHAYVIMVNHIHLLVTPCDELALARFVKGFAQRYAQTRNAQRGNSGKLFEARFFSEPVKDANHLGCTHAYIEDNPRRAGLGDAADFRWSTYALHAGRGRRDVPLASFHVESPWYQSLGPDLPSRQAAYRAWFEQRATAAIGAELTKADHYERIASVVYTRRVRRPDGTRASDGHEDYR